MAVTLYKRQKEILEYLRQYQQKYGTSPTLVEIAAALKLKSLATVHEHLAALARKGVIRKLTGIVRGIEILDKKLASSLQGVELPILGFIAAGAPIEPFRDPAASIPISPFLLSGKAKAFVLQVKGDSMIEDGILDGDWVVCEEAQEAANGQIVVAMLDNGVVTLKRFYQEPTRVRLEPANAKMKPIYTKDVVIQGKVVGVVRKYG